MSLSIRPVNFATDYDELLSCCDETSRTSLMRHGFPWLYQENPAGPARSWFLCDERGTAVGVTLAFPSCRCGWTDFGGLRASRRLWR